MNKADVCKNLKKTVLSRVFLEKGVTVTVCECLYYHLLHADPTSRPDGNVKRARWLSSIQCVLYSLAFVTRDTRSNHAKPICISYTKFSKQFSMKYLETYITQKLPRRFKISREISIMIFSFVTVTRIAWWPLISLLWYYMSVYSA